MQNTPKTYRDLVEILVDIKKLLWKLYENSGYEEKDIRARIFLNIGGMIIANAIVISNILLNVEEEKIPKKAYRTLFGLTEPEKIKKMAENLSQYTRLSIVTLFQFQIENLFVNLLHALKPDERPPRGYGKIVERLMENISISDKEEKKKILNILQFIRNSLHSNGKHNNDPLTIEIDGFEFKFEKGESVSCASWNGIPIALKAISKLIDEIIKSDEIKSITTTIPDQFDEPE